MKKFLIDFRIIKNERLSDMYSLFALEPTNGQLPEMQPGQFVQVEVPNSKSTYLRRPISINYVDYANNQLWLLVRKAGEGTSSLMKLAENDIINLMLPLGNGFSIFPGETMLLIGGGVGVAPLLYLGKIAKEAGANVKFLLGARTESDLLELDKFEAIG